MLIAVNVTTQVHLIVGTNSLAAARCNKSLQSGARPIVVAPETCDVHFSLRDCVEQGRVQWIKREFQDEDLTTLGREEVDKVVDAVFVTASSVEFSKSGKFGFALSFYFPLLLANFSCSTTNRHSRYTSFETLQSIANTRQSC